MPAEQKYSKDEYENEENTIVFWVLDIFLKSSLFKFWILEYRRLILGYSHKKIKIFESINEDINILYGSDGKNIFIRTKNINTRKKPLINSKYDTGLYTLNARRKCVMNKLIIKINTISSTTKKLYLKSASSLVEISK